MQISVAQMASERKRCRSDQSETISADERMVANEERTTVGRGGTGAVHAEYHVVIGVCFIDETPAMLVDDDGAGFASVQVAVRKDRHLLIVVGHGSGRPESGAGELIVNCG